MGLFATSRAWGPDEDRLAPFPVDARFIDKNGFSNPVLRRGRDSRVQARRSETVVPGASGQSPAPHRGEDVDAVASFYGPPAFPDRFQPDEG
jgi:hypothetical protein